MTLIGTATALGLGVDIPIITRSLAASFALVKEHELPLDVNQDILLTLDAGGDDKFKIVPNYELMWWTGRKPRDLNIVEILKDTTLEKCLANYHEQIRPSTAARSTTGSSVPYAGSNPSLPVPKTGTDPSNYRQLLSDVLRDILKFQQFASIMSTSNKNLMNLGIRRAAAFNLLHEAAILKETAGSPESSPATQSVPELISAVSRNAESELTRLQKLPPSSYKWTWGTSLTEKEVISLRRSGTKPGRFHSGYDVSLKEGNKMGEDSASPSSIFGLDNLQIDPAPIPPPTDLGFPHYFSRPDHRRFYDPYEVTNPTLSQYIPTQPGHSQTSILTKFDPIKVAEAWSSTSDIGSVSVEAQRSNALLAERWSSSDSGSDKAAFHTSTAFDPGNPSLSRYIQTQAGPSMPSIPAKSEAIRLAEAWSSDSDPGSGPVRRHSSTALFITDRWSRAGMFQYRRTYPVLPTHKIRQGVHGLLSIPLTWRKLGVRTPSMQVHTPLLSIPLTSQRLGVQTPTTSIQVPRKISLYKRWPHRL